MATVKRTNPEAVKKLDAMIKELGSAQVKIGWFENDKEENGTPTAYVAAIQEFGTPHIPPRLGLRETVMAKTTAWASFSKAAAKQVLQGKYTGRDMVNALGERAMADLYKRINSNPAPPLSELTLALRKQREQGKKITGALVWQTSRRLNSGAKVALSTNTQSLVDTGHMLNSLSVKVENI